MKNDGGHKLQGLYAIVDAGVSLQLSLPQLALDYLKGGVKLIQLRDKKRKSSPEAYQKFCETAFQIKQFKKDFPFQFILNDDLEMALEAGADGIHIGKDDISIEECRQKLGPQKIIGYSSHSLEEALEAESRGADIVAFGAIFPTTTKGPGHPVQGTEKLKKVVESLCVPVVAIGGIGRDNIKEVLSTGVALVAMISALAYPASGNRIEEARWFCDQMKT